MNEALIVALLERLVLPIVRVFLLEHKRMPSDAEVLALLDSYTLTKIGQGEAFLDEKR